MADEPKAPGQDQKGQDVDLAAALAAAKESNRGLLEDKAKTKQRISELEAKAARAEELEGKLSKLSQIAGIDLGADPDRVVKQKEEDARVAAEKRNAVKDEVTKTLLKMGRPIDEDLFDLLVNGAHTSRHIGFDDSGKVTGAKDYLEKVFGKLADPDAKKEPQNAPRLPRPGAEQNPANMDAAMAELYKSVSNWQQLVKMGVQRKEEFARRFPQRYTELESAHFNRYRVR